MACLPNFIGIDTIPPPKIFHPQIWCASEPMTSTAPSTHLRIGIPRIAELDRLKQAPAFQGPATFNEEFLKRHDVALRKYGSHWGKQPFKLWSRRWEYPFAADALLRFANEQSQGSRFNVMDAGSGVTFFPY